MRFDLTIEVDPERVRKATSYSKVMAAIRRALVKASNQYVRLLTTYSMRGPLHKRTGMLGRSWLVSDLSEDDQGLVIGVGSVTPEDANARRAGLQVGARLPYASIHDKGGIITPEKARLLAIPMPPDRFTQTHPVMTPGGVQNYGPREIESIYGKSPFTFKSKMGNLFLAVNNNNQLELLFQLKDSVFIKGTNYIENAFALGNEKAQAVLDAEVDRALQD